MDFEDKKDDDLPPENSDGCVGYGRPPARTRFKPGQSGNPSGRPKGSLNKIAIDAPLAVFDVIRAGACKEFHATDGGKPVSITMLEAAWRTVAVNAVKGQPWASKLFFKNVLMIEAHNRKEQDEFLRLALERKSQGTEEIARRHRAGITDISDILPHPDDICYNTETGRVEIRGPTSEKDRLEWRRMREYINEMTDFASTIKVKMQQVTCEKRRASLNEMWNAMIDRIEWFESGIFGWDR